MRACRLVMASALLGLAVATPFAATSASFQVGITIVKGCDARTTSYSDGDSGAAVHAQCSTNTPYNIAVGSRPMHDGRSRPAIVPDDTRLVSVGQEIATMTF